jgi:hypothetical protein
MTQATGKNDLRSDAVDSQVSDQMDEPDVADISGAPAIRTSSMDPAEGPDDPDYDGE